jgi:hypothetical protein
VKYRGQVVGVPLWAHPHRRLSEPAVAQSYPIPAGADGDGGPPADGSLRVLELRVLWGGTCHAIALWVEVAGLESGVADVTRPWQRQGLRLLETPRALVAGESLAVMVRRRAGGTRLELELVE